MILNKTTWKLYLIVSKLMKAIIIMKIKANGFNISELKMTSKIKEKIIVIKLMLEQS